MPGDPLRARYIATTYLDEVRQVNEIRNMLGFIESTTEWYDKIRDVPTSTLQKLMKLGAGIARVVKD